VVWNPKRVELLFEFALWRGRILIVVGVLASMVMAVGALFMAAVDVLYLLVGLRQYATLELPTEVRTQVRAQLVANIIKATDSFLIAAILIIVGLALYELFVNKIDAAERSEVGPRLLRVRTVDDLKDRVAKLILLVLVIEFFQRAVRMSYESPLDLLYLALSILLVGAALALSALAGHSSAQETDHG